ncbi:MAG: SLBB domain-containing protein [Verrucomicrobiota bacterium]
MIFRLALCLFGISVAHGQELAESQAPVADVPGSALVVEPEPKFRAPAPPVNADDSLNAMLELDSTAIIEVGEQLEYRVIEDRIPPEVLLVDEDGEMSIPLVGNVQAAGQTLQKLALEISERLREEYYYQATVIIEPHQDTGSRGIVYVMGEVNNAGAIQIPSGEILRVSGAIIRAGGFTRLSDASRVLLVRPDVKNPESSERFDLNVSKIMETGRLDQDLIVKANDRVFVSQRGDTSGQYIVSGAVRAPGVYPISVGQKIAISQAILGAGGFAQFANGGSVKLIRHDEAGVRTELEIDVDEILEEGQQEMDVQIQSGDRIIVPEKFISF